MKSGKLVLGVLAGLTVGAIAGILFAPDKGSKTRKRIVSKGKDYVGGLHERFDDLVDTIAIKYRGNREDGELASNGNTKRV